MPNRKVGAGALAGAFAWMVVWASKTFANVDIPAEGGIAFSTLFTFVVQYFIPNTSE